MGGRIFQLLALLWRRPGDQIAPGLPHTHRLASLNLHETLELSLKRLRREKAEAGRQASRFFPLENPMDHYPLWKVFVIECRDFALECIEPLLALIRWMRSRRQ